MPRFVPNLIFRIALVLAAMALSLSAQTPSAQTQVLRSTTQLVEVDTVATDSHGKPVTDLQQDEIRLFEDGKERPLSHFSFEKVEPLNANAEKRLHDLAQNQRAGIYANFTKETSGVPPNGCIVLLIDWQNTPMELQPVAQQELKKFLDTVDLSKPLAIYSLDSTLHLIQSFTSDRQVLKSNVERYGLHNTNLQPEKQADSSLHSQTTDFRVMNSATALLGIAGILEPIRGHKSLIWLSGSFPTALMPTDRKGLKAGMEANQGGWLFGERRDYSGLITKVSHILSAANIAVYPVDAEGLQGTMADTSDESFVYSLNPKTQNIMERQEAMRDFADLTGGRAFYNHNDIGNEIANAYADANTFYALAFTPAKSKPDGKVHTVRVDCRRPGVRLRYRKSYFADDKQALAEMKRAQLELFVRTPGQSADGLPFMAKIDKQQNDRLKLWLDGNSLSIVGGQEPFLNVDIGIATFDDHGILLLVYLRHER